METNHTAAGTLFAFIANTANGRSLGHARLLAADLTPTQRSAVRRLAQRRLDSRAAFTRRSASSVLAALSVR